MDIPCLFFGPSRVDFFCGGRLATLYQVQYSRTSIAHHYTALHSSEILVTWITNPFPRRRHARSSQPIHNRLRKNVYALCSLYVHKTRLTAAENTLRIRARVEIDI